MDNEKYGIELELITGKFNKQVEKEKKIINSIDTKKKVKYESFADWIAKAPKKKVKSFIDNDIKVSKGQTEKFKEYKEYVDSVGNSSTTILNMMDNFARTGKLVEDTNQKIKNTAQSTQSLNNETQKVNKNIKDATKDTKDLNNQASRLKITFNTNSIQKNIDKMTSKIKRFGLSLLGIRSIWSLISRASSAYLSQNQELADKLQGVWVGLGSLLAPVIEFIINIFAKAVGFINAFIKALTGVDLLAKSTAKSVNKTTGAVKSLNKALAGFDELQNLDTDAGGGGTGLGNLGDMADLVEQFELGGNVFKNFKKWLLGSDKNDIKGIIEDNVAIIKKTFEKELKPIVKIFDKFLWQPFKEGATKVINMLPLNLIKDKVADVLSNEVMPVWKKQWSAMANILDPILKPFYEKFSEIGIKIYNAIVPYINQFIRKINETFGFLGVHLNEWETKSEQVSKNSSVKFTNAMDSIKRTSNLVTAYITGDLSAIEKKENDVSKNTINIKADTTGIMNINERLHNMKNDLTTLATTKWAINATIEARFGKSFNSMFEPLRKIGFNIPYLATGTNYVPEDQLAMIHKGEAVVPKKFNSQEYFGGNNETNSKLDTLIDAVNNIEINPYTTVRDVGKASLSYINSKSRQLGMSVVN